MTIMTFAKRVFAAALVIFALPIAASADDDVLITKPSAHSVSVTLDRLEMVLKSKGMTIFTRIDHAAGAKKVGIDLPPTSVLIFGNPKIGTQLMTANRAIAIDLPLKALAWQDKDGKVYLSYTKPSELEDRFDIEDRDAVFKKMTCALDKMTSLAVSTRGSAN